MNNKERLSGFGVTVPAIDRFIATRLKRNFGLFATLGTGSRIHLARASIITSAITTTSLRLSGLPASGTTLGLIGKAFGCVKLLLFNCERKGLTAIGTLEGFFGVSH